MWLLKTLRISWASGAWAGKAPENLDQLRLSRDQVPPDADEALAAKRAELRALGFESFLITGPGENLYPSKSVMEFFIDPAGRTLGKVALERAHITIVTTSFFSELADGTVLDTTDRSLISGGPQFKTVAVPGADVPTLLQNHEGRLSENAAAVRAFGSAEGACDFVWRNTLAYWQFNVARRALVELTPDEVEQARKQTAAVAEAGAASDNPDTPVLIEMARIAAGKSTWKQAAWPFVITLLLFVGAGYASFEPEFVVPLVIVLFVHELGHYMAMRAFGYKNLKMIFVPLAGAAVLGQHYNVPGWKKAIVSLMGPLPGIVAGAGAAWGLFSFFTPSPATVPAISLLLILNAINLLPIYPLDGGHYLNAILFCRNAKIELGFRAIAAVALAVAGFAFSDYLLMILGFFGIMGLGLNFRLARLTEDLRRHASMPEASDPNELPAELRLAVAAKVREALKKPFPAKVVASHTLGIFERLNARPPGAIASLALLVVYFFTFAIAAVGAVGLFRPDAFRVQRIEPFAPFQCGKHEPLERFGNFSHVCVATFADAADRDAFQDAAQRLTLRPAQVSGSSVFVTLDADRRRVMRLAKTHKGRPKLFADGWTLAQMSWTFDAPSAEVAERIEREISEFAQLKDLGVLPPWSPAVRDAAAHPEQRSARDALARLRELENEASAAFWKEMSDGGNARSNKFANAQSDRAKRVVEAVRLSATNLHPATVAWFTNYISLNATNYDAFLDGPGAEVARMLGRPAQAATNDADALLFYADIERSEGNSIRIQEMSFANLESNLAAFGNYLCELGCANIKYSIH